MALITGFEVIDGEGRVNPTQVVGHVRVFSGADRAPIVQINTMGSAGRETPGKVNQTIQLNRDSARVLFDILKDAYGFKSEP